MSTYKIEMDSQGRFPNQGEFGKNGTNFPKKKEFLSFLKAIASFKGDLSSFTAPPFILSTTSLSEYSAYWAEQPSLFVAPANESDPEKRALLVLKWFLTTLKQQYDHRKDRKKGKPLNPFLGELFLGKWEDAAGTTQLVSEQVSHHPPTTAYRIWNEEHGVTLDGYTAQKTYFDRTVHIKKAGHAVLHISKYSEDYLITLPGAQLVGLIPPPPYPELDNDKPTYIQSSSGYTAKIVYSGKGWLRGKKNSFQATLFPEGEEQDVLYTVEGQWTGAFTIRDAKAKTDLETYDATTSPDRLSTLLVTTLDKQDPLETRKAWGKVTTAIMNGDMAGVNAEKSKLENDQRALRKEEKLEGRDWPRRYFSVIDNHPLVEKLSAKIGATIEPDQTGGIWQWDEEKYQSATSGAVSNGDMKVQ